MSCIAKSASTKKIHGHSRESETSAVALLKIHDTKNGGCTLLEEKRNYFIEEFLEFDLSKNRIHLELALGSAFLAL